MKKVIINVVLVILIFISYFLQSNFFNWFTIAGISPNLFVILIVFIGLFGNRFMGVSYGILLGFFLDYLFRSKVGISAIALGLVGVFAKIFDKNFSKDSRITVMLMMSALTIFYEVFSTNLEFLYFIKILIVEVIYNVILTVILYPQMQKFGYYIENTYNGNKILTRYF